MGNRIEVLVGDKTVALSAFTGTAQAPQTGRVVTAKILDETVNPVQIYDWDDNTFKTLGAETTPTQALVEYDTINAPGQHRFIWDSSLTISARKELKVIYKDDLARIDVDIFDFIFKISVGSRFNIQWRSDSRFQIRFRGRVV